MTEGHGAEVCVEAAGVPVTLTQADRRRPQ